MHHRPSQNSGKRWGCQPSLQTAERVGDLEATGREDGGRVAVEIAVRAEEACAAALGDSVLVGGVDVVDAVAGDVVEVGVGRSSGQREPQRPHDEGHGVTAQGHCVGAEDAGAAAGGDPQFVQAVRRGGGDRIGRVAEVLVQARRGRRLTQRVDQHDGQELAGHGGGRAVHQRGGAAPVDDPVDVQPANIVEGPVGGRHVGELLAAAYTPDVLVAVGVGTVGQAVIVVVVEVVAGGFRGRFTVDVIRAVHVVAVDVSVAIVIDAVVADLVVRGADGARVAVGVVAVDVGVAIVVDAVVADLGAGVADGAGAAVGVVAVDEAVAIVVDAVIADLAAGGADGARIAVGVVAVDPSVPVVVLMVVADFHLGLAEGVLEAVGVVTVDETVVIVVLAVGAFFPRQVGGLRTTQSDE